MTNQHASSCHHPAARLWPRVTAMALAFTLVYAGPAAAQRGKSSVTMAPVSYADLPGWRSDDHLAAFTTFYRSCEKIISNAHRRKAAGKRPNRLTRVCARALAKGNIRTASAARQFFEANFTPHSVRSGRRGLLTGYYEPELPGSRTRTRRFRVPIYRRPSDLVLLNREMKEKARNAKLDPRLSYAQMTGSGLRPYPTRRKIEKGYLAGRGLELVWLENYVDAFFMHVQGSARIRFTDGTTTRIAFAAKNGHPYSSVGKYLIRHGKIDRDKVSLKTVKSWLRRNGEGGLKAMWQNKSFIFFRELDAEQGADGPVGAQGVALTPGRTLAVDRRYHQLGSPVWLDVRGLRIGNRRHLRRLMVAQDVGSAIKGPERGDIFWGSGAMAGRTAGRTYHPGNFYVLLPGAKSKKFGWSDDNTSIWSND